MNYFLRNYLILVPEYKEVKVDVDANNVSDRDEWGTARYHSNYDPCAAFELEIQWLVATGAILGQLVCTLLKILDLFVCILLKILDFLVCLLLQMLDLLICALLNILDPCDFLYLSSVFFFYLGVSICISIYCFIFHCN